MSAKTQTAEQHVDEQTEQKVKQPLVDISDIIVSETTVSELQGNQLWMRPERDAGH